MSWYYSNEDSYFPVGIAFGNTVIRFYALCIMAGIFVAVFLGIREIKKMKMDVNIIYDGVLIVIPLSVIGARLYYVLIDNFSKPYYYNWDFTKIFDFTSGGLAIHGGIIVAAISTLIYCKIRNVNVWKILDIVAPGFLIAQVIGRWGNFFNQEVYGSAVTGDNPLGFLPTFIRNQMYIDGSYRQPLFLYEGLLNLVLFIVFMIIRRKKILKIGDMAFIYCAWYGIIRAILEPLRDTKYILSSASGNMQSVITSIILIIVGVGGLILKYVLCKNLPYYSDVTYVTTSKEKDEELSNVIKEVIDDDK